jgi:hypothetical protein
MKVQAVVLDAETPPIAIRRSQVGVVLAVASFLIYAATVFALPQVRDSRYCCEQSSFAAAVSNIVYGSRVGSMYMGVFDLFTRHSTEPLPQALKEIGAELPAQPPGKLSPTTLDGNGVGYPLVATAAFRLFGFHWWAPVAMMLILMGSSMAAFLRRFPPTLVTLYFSGLTMMLFTILVWDPGWRANIAVGGIRYFSIVGILPLFHILLSLMERQPSGGVAPLTVQTIILTIAAMARGTAATAFVAIALVSLVLACDRTPRSALIRKLATIGVASVMLVVAVALIVSPEWRTTGRFQTIIWTRVLQGLGLNPDLPSDELKKMYPCEKYVPGGFPASDIGDRGVGCIWFAYVAQNAIPLYSIWNNSFDGEFDAAMRSAFFKIALKYPRQTLQTFIYYKPKAIVVAINGSFKFNLSGYSPLSIVLLLASIVVGLFGATTAVNTGRETAVVLLTMLFNITAYMAAYASPSTAADLLLCCLILAGLALGAIFSDGAKLLRTTNRRRLAKPPAN